MTGAVPFKPTGAEQLESYIRRHSGSIPRFCEEHRLDRIKVQRAINGDIQRIDVDFAFDIEHATDGIVPADSWCSPDEVRDERRKRRAERSTKFSPTDEQPTSERVPAGDKGDAA